MIHLFLTIALAGVLPGEDLFVAEHPTPPAAEQKEAKAQSKVRPSQSKSKSSSIMGNLPEYYNSHSQNENPVSELVSKPSGSFDVFQSLRVGDQIDAEISHSIIAFRDEKAPVIAAINSRGLTGVRFIGTSSLEPNSRRIFVGFDRVVVGERIFGVKAVGVSSFGQPGLIGKYYSREGEYFAGDFISSFVAGYFDGLVPRNTNAFGQIEIDTSVNSAVKKGLASGALSSAERFREKLKRSPEFSEIQGPLQIKIMILDQVKKE